MRIIERVFFHHSASKQNLGVAALERTHQKWNGGRDIEYHYVINVIQDFAQTHICRPITSRGWHAGPKGNGNSVGICIAGWNGDSAPRPGMGWTTRQVELGQQLLDALRKTNNIKWWGGHRDVKATLCPGLEVRDVFR
jgi:hypothetical protein